VLLTEGQRGINIFCAIVTCPRDICVFIKAGIYSNTIKVTLDGLMVTRPKICGFKPGRGHRFLSVIKICGVTSLEGK
jgi:hypothetical protein